MMSKNTKQIESDNENDDSEIEEIDESEEDNVEETQEVIKIKSKKQPMEYTAKTYLAILQELNNKIEPLESKKINNMVKQLGKFAKKFKKTKGLNLDGTQTITKSNMARPIPPKFKLFYENNLKHDEEFKNDKEFKNFDINTDQQKSVIIKIIYYYIRKNKLYMTDEKGTVDKKRTSPDETLMSLLNMNKDDILEFKNMMKYMGGLYKTIDT